jgi:DNA-directed RNA polymerase specialized sigma24 family protein
MKPQNAAAPSKSRGSRSRKLTAELDELQDIKRLLILLLQANKVSQPQIAKTLGITDRQVRRLLNPGGERDDREA